MQFGTTSILLAIVAFSTVQAAPPPVTRHISILPIVECPNPDDSPYPQIIIAPSIAGQDLAANQYVVCVGGKPLVFNCAQGLFFNWDKMSCDFPYELRANTGFLNNGTLEGVIPGGPIQVPAAPQYPIPYRRGVVVRPIGGIPPISTYPITKPNPAVFPPRPVLPANLPPLYPITKPEPGVIHPIPVLPGNHLPPGPRPVPYYHY